jgi:hypothetical protein
MKEIHGGRGSGKNQDFRKQLLGHAEGQRHKESLKTCVVCVHSFHLVGELDVEVPTQRPCKGLNVER